VTATAVAPPTHADGMLFMEYYKIWDTPRDSEAWTLLHRLKAEGAFDDAAAFAARVPRSSPDFGLFDRVCCSFEQAGVLMRNGLLHPDLYFEGWASPRPVWNLVAEAVRGLRETNAEAYVNFEWLAERYDEWLAARAPR
jgi:hypothetical protein